MSRHILYIDINDYCPIGCAHCMYASLHGNKKRFLSLNSESRVNLSRLINDAALERLAISGLGEPLFTPEGIMEVLGLLDPQCTASIEIITSAKLPYTRFVTVLDKISEILAHYGRSAQIRISVDTFHDEAIDLDPIPMILKVGLKNHWDNISFSFRGLISERMWLFGKICRYADSLGYAARVKQKSIMRAEIEIGKNNFPCLFQDHVTSNHGAHLGLSNYLSILEEDRNGPFIFGNPASPGGLDVAIKPDGSLKFYGCEFFNAGTIYSKILSWKTLEEWRDEDPLLRVLHNVPLRRVIKTLPFEVDDIGINSPYWLFTGLFEQDLFPIARRAILSKFGHQT